MNRQLLIKDIKHGILLRVFFFLPILFFALYAVFNASQIAEMFGVQPSFLTASMTALKGVKLQLAQGENPIIPPLYLMINAWLAVIVAYYPYNDMKEYGVQVFTRCGQKASWWISKCVWNLLTVLLFYLILFVTILLASVVCGHPLFSLTESVWIVDFMAQAEFPKTGTLLLYILVLPFLTSAALSMLQMVISIVSTPTIGAAFPILMVTATIAIPYRWFPVNALMVMRMDICNPAGMQFIPTVLLDCLVIVASVTVGILILKKKDIF